MNKALWTLVIAVLYLVLVLRPSGNLERLWGGVDSLVTSGDVAAFLRGLYVLTPVPHFFIFVLCLVLLRLPDWLRRPVPPSS